MKKLLSTLMSAVLVSGLGIAQSADTGAKVKPVLRSGVKNIDMVVDGHLLKGGWNITTQYNPDIYTTTAKEVGFLSDIDTLFAYNANEWDSYDFDIITTYGDTSHVRVERVAANPFENPDPRLLKISDSGKLTREQALFDMDALMYGLNEIHPDIYSVCRQEDLFRAVNRAKASFSDSVTLVELYKAAAPVVSMIGDGHTNLSFPTKALFTDDYKRMPVYVKVNSDRSVICTTSIDSIVPRGARIVSINDMSTDSILDAMLPYVSGEREHFKLSRISSTFQRLFHMLYESDEYMVKFIPEGSKKIETHVFKPELWADIVKRCPPTRNRKKYEIYSYEIDPANNVAIMDFRSFEDTERMQHFADSMFKDLKNNNIGNLIIDVRNNGGGNSNVGDVLLRYISPEPFVQMDKALIRITPVSAKLMGGNSTPLLMFHEADTAQFIQPRTAAEGFYDGNVYLLTSNNTFSSAGSFSWTFKECGMGTVVGEETGGMNVCYGDVLMYTLPISGLKSSVSFKRFWQLRADENDIHGTLPDVSVPADEALDKALELVKKNSRKRK